jgi:hypothetical protein
MLNHTFSLHIWIRPAGTGTLFSVNRFENVLTGGEGIARVTAGRSSLMLEVEEDRETVMNLKSPPLRSEEASWVQVGTVISFRGSQARLYVNDQIIASREYSHVFRDNPDFPHLLGAEGTFTKQTNHFSGLVFSLCIYQHEMVPVVSEVSPCGRGFCDT